MPAKLTFGHSGNPARWSMSASGIVTLTCAGHINARLWNRSYACSHPTPLLESFAAVQPERTAGDRMALDVEEVVDGGVKREEPLR